MEAESLLKTFILTHGIQFSGRAVAASISARAKQQNLVYNAPRESQLHRPQELLIAHQDGYEVCVSAVAPVPGRTPAYLDCEKEQLRLSVPSWLPVSTGLTGLRFVREPEYYSGQLPSGRPITRIVSACGLDELNVWVWHDCANSQLCTFCGINAVQELSATTHDHFSARKLAKRPQPEAVWNTTKSQYVNEVVAAVEIALGDRCYAEHAHLILTSGNLAAHQLDLQATIYAELAQAISDRFPGRFAEGIVAVTAPPRDLRLLREMQRAGITIVVLNLEAYGPDVFVKHCPGKAEIGQDHYLAALQEAVSVFGTGRAWSNFVLGLDDIDLLLAGCDTLAARGIVPGANVLHLDHGARPDLAVPALGDTIRFFRRLAAILMKYDLRPYYCEKALRTSLANEAYQGRLGKNLVPNDPYEDHCQYGGGDVQVIEFPVPALDH
jgi:hypothetical protein